ncbi:MAG: DUF4350 domain-containing protein [Leifsonia xyli]|nr:MAG: DUF4350 domain-containing protein [Leifsonia xyli]
MSATTSAPAAPTPAGDAAASTPTGRRARIGRLLLGIAIALLVVFGVLIVWAAGRDAQSGEHLRSPDDPRPGGAMALAQVLGAQGVDVQITRSFGQTEAAVGDGRGVTLVVDDDWWVLTEEAYQRIATLSSRLVLVQPSDVALAELTPTVDYAGFGGGTLDADCDLPAVQRAESIDAGGDSYTAPADAVRCLGTATAGYGLVQLERDGRRITVLGLGDALTNENITRSGNAALALGLLGEQPRLVWYQPDADDLAFQDANGLAAYQADWYLPLVVLLLLVGVAAAVWRGRRMGPVVVEDLPVEVRSSETMEGRARLYERGRSRDHALATLRTATLARLARTLGLGRTASDPEIIAATAATTGRDPATLAFLLQSAPASDERSFVALSDALLQLEQELAGAVRPR